MVSVSGWFSGGSQAPQWRAVCHLPFCQASEVGGAGSSPGTPPAWFLLSWTSTTRHRHAKGCAGSRSSGWPPPTNRSLQSKAPASPAVPQESMGRLVRLHRCGAPHCRVRRWLSGCATSCPSVGGGNEVVATPGGSCMRASASAQGWGFPKSPKRVSSPGQRDALTWTSQDVLQERGLQTLAPLVCVPPDTSLLLPTQPPAPGLPCL